MELYRCTWSGQALGTKVKLVVVTGDVGAGEASLSGAAEDLEETEQALSRFRAGSELSVLNREGTIIAGPRLLTAVVVSARAYEWSDGLLDPRVIDALEGYGYRGSLPTGDVGAVAPCGPPGPADMRTWVDEDGGRITLPSGVRLDLAGVGKALGIGWAASRLAGHAGLLVDVGGDIVALGHDERDEPWRVAVDHGKGVVDELSGHALAVATSTTRLRSWTAGGREAHHIVDPRTGAPSEGEFSYATVAAPTILGADLAAKLLIIGGREAEEKVGEGYRMIVSDRDGETWLLGGQEAASVTS